jgi:hypothetical protein
MASCRIQWLYLAVHGCKTYLNLNLNLNLCNTCRVNEANKQTTRQQADNSLQSWGTT